MPGLENKEFYLIATAADGKAAMQEAYQMGKNIC